jgi:nucleoside-diphosphate-sugar epimerase
LGTLTSLPEEPTSREEKVRKMEMKVFMTGATGYVGSTVAEALKKRGYQVMTLVRTEMAFINACFAQDPCTTERSVGQ